MFKQLDIKHKVFKIALSAGPLKWLNTLKQIVSYSSFDHFGVCLTILGSYSEANIGSYQISFIEAFAKIVHNF